MIPPLPSSPSHLYLWPPHSLLSRLTSCFVILLTCQARSHLRASALVVPSAEKCLPQIPAWFPPSPPSSFCSHATSSVRLYRTPNLKDYPLCSQSTVDTPFSDTVHLLLNLFVQCLSPPPEWQQLEHGDFYLIFTFCPFWMLSSRHRAWYVADA